MEINLYHLWECPYSAKVRNFIRNNHMEGQVNFIELDEDPEGAQRLRELSGRIHTPTLVVQGRPILDDEIIYWLEENLLGRSKTASA